MKEAQPKIYSEHQELSPLLPWFVNKSLQGAELKAVENHVAECLVCKRELLQLQKLAQAVIQESALDSAEKASFSRLKMRLHGDVQTTIPQTQGNIRPLNVQASSKTSLGSSWLRPGLAMAAAILLSVTLVMPQYADKPVNNYRTLSDGQPEQAINRNEIRVVFAEGINPQQKSKILERVHGQIIDSPTAQGVYTVRLERDMASTHLLDVIELLKKDSSIVFAEPAYALLSSMHEEK